MKVRHWTMPINFSSKRPQVPDLTSLDTAKKALEDVGQNPSKILEAAKDVVVVLLPDRTAAELDVRRVGLDPDVLRQNRDQVRRVLGTESTPTGDARATTETRAVQGPLSKKEGKAKSPALEERWSGVGDLEAKEVLAAVRLRAENWRTGTASVLGVITAALVISGTEDTVRLFENAWVRGPLAFLLVVAAVLGFNSLRLAILAANGPSWLDTKIKEVVATPRPTAERDLKRARAAAKDLASAQTCLSWAIVLFVVLVACFWVIPHDL